jgi:hypothetical protein
MNGVARICGIHQPNFFPWLGYFDKIARSDVFVFLDAVSYPKSGKSMGSWCNRVKLNISGRAAWVSCPVVREPGIQLINTVRINDARDWRDDLRRTIETNYRFARNFAPAFELVDQLLDFETELLAEFNINAITAIAAEMGVTAEFVIQSQLPPMNQTGTDRLIAIAKAVGATAYLCGGGAGGYQDDAAFEGAGVDLVYQDFAPGPYGPPERFIPGLSVIDWLMHHAADDAPVTTGLAR